MQQPYYGQQQQQMGGWGGPAGLQDSNSMLPPPLNPGAPADAETLKRLKEELLQQKQQTAPGTAKGGAAGAGSGTAGSNKKVVVREAAGQRWVDPTLAEWPDNDFRIFVGDIGNEVNDEALSKAFSRYPSFAKAKVSEFWGGLRQCWARWCGAAAWTSCRRFRAVTQCLARLQDCYHMQPSRHRNLFLSVVARLLHLPT